MRAIYFVESKGVKYYKTDTFWSKSTDFRHAKDHDDSQHDQDRFLDSLLYRPNRPDFEKDDKYINFWDNTIYGYQTLNDLGEITSTINLKMIHYDHSDKLLKHTDYKQLIREEKINSIL
jgi:predicted class III extradiol MEMO1 family dioxygenase